MRSTRVPLLLAVAAVLTAWTLPAQAQSEASDALRRDIDFAKSKVYPALVNISVVVRQFSGGRTERAPAAGSGVIVSPAGHVLTNFHVAGHTVRITCTLPDGEVLDADVLDHDPLTDLSVLKLRLKNRPASAPPLPFATLGDSSKLSVGDYVLAMGNPLTLSSSLTLGVVSNPSRVFTDFTGTEMQSMHLEEGELTGLFTRWIQHDALILPGNSGGPLVNLRGEVVGINELGGNGMGFAIPSNLAARVLGQILANGSVRRGWLGASVMPVSKINRKTGALVSFVVPKSPAAQARLEAGDILMTFNNKPVDVRFFEQVPDFYQAVADTPIGTAVPMSFLRNGELHTTTVTLSLMQPSVGAEAEFRPLGLTARDITPPMALVRRYPNADGVVITGIRPGYPLEEARPRIQEGDVILKIGSRKVTSLKVLREIIKSLPKHGSIVMKLRRDEQQILTVFTIEKPQPEESGGELRQAWLGVETQVMTTKLATALGMKGTHGFRITQVLPDTEAAKAGLQIGDVLTAIDGDSLDAYRPRDSEELKLEIQDLPIGEMADVSLVRDGKPMKLKVKLQADPGSASDAKTARCEQFEFGVRQITFLDRVTNHWPDSEKGLLVTDAAMGGWANMAGLRIGDLVVRINGTPIPDIKTFNSVMKKVMKDHPKEVRVFVRRDYRTAFVFIEPDWKAISKS